jgi:endonuclease III
MGKINHSKYKNSGIIFEMLVRQLTNEAMANKDSKAISIIKKYYTKTELAKENKLYQTIIQTNGLNEHKAETIINTVSELSKRLDRKKLNKEKYNLIKEIKDNYDLEEFFKTSITNYKPLASIYTIIESNFIDNPNPPK